MPAQVLELDFDLQKDLVQPLMDIERDTGPIADRVNATMIAGLDLLVEQIALRLPGPEGVNTGALRGSIARGEPVRRGAMLEGIVGTPLIYGLPVELGRRPGGKMPPVDAILFWVIRKQLVSRAEAPGFAWAIAQKIATDGTEGMFMFRDGFKAAAPHIERIWDDMLDWIVNYLATKP